MIHRVSCIESTTNSSCYGAGHQLANHGRRQATVADASGGGSEC